MPLIISMAEKESAMIHSERKMFSTESGTDYFLLDTGYWYRKLSSGTSFHNYLYIGSADPSKNRCLGVNGTDSMDYGMLIRQIVDGHIDGFVPSFEVNFLPIGIRGIEPKDVGYDSVLRMAKIRDITGIHVGHRIAKVHETILAKDRKWLEFIVS